MRCSQRPCGAQIVQAILMGVQLQSCSLNTMRIAVILLELLRE